MGIASPPYCSSQWIFFNFFKSFQLERVGMDPPTMPKDSMIPHGFSTPKSHCQNENLGDSLHFHCFQLISRIWLNHVMPWWVKAHYGDPLWDVTLYYFVGMWMFPTSNFWKIFTIFFHIIKKYNLDKKLKNKLFHFIL